MRLLRAFPFPSLGRNARRRLVSGLTLVELMVAMAIGLLIVLALITLLSNVNRNNSEMSKTNRMIENGRFALQFLQNDVVHGGYWAGYLPQFDDFSFAGVPTDAPSDAPDPCPAAAWSATDITNLIGIPVQTYFIGSPVPSPTVPVCANIVTNPKANTDVLIVRHVETCLPGVDECAADTTGTSKADMYFQSSRCAVEVAAGNTYVLGTSTFTLKNRDCATVAEKRKFVSSIYYVRSYATQAGDGIPTLMRSQFSASEGTPKHLGAQALIEGIEGFRVELGMDSLGDTGVAVDYTTAVAWVDPMNLTSPTNRGDGIPDGVYVHCNTAGIAPCTAAQLANVVSVKLHVLVRGEKASPGYTDGKTYSLGSATVGPFTDGYKRHVFSTTVRLHNVSGRRETP